MISETTTFRQFDKKNCVPLVAVAIVVLLLHSHYTHFGGNEAAYARLVAMDNENVHHIDHIPRLVLCAYENNDRDKIFPIVYR